MLRGRRIKRRVTSAPTSCVKRGPLIFSTVEPSHSSAADWRWMAGSTLNQMRECNKLRRQASANKRIHLRPIHLLMAVVGLMLSAPTPFVSYRRSGTPGPSSSGAFLAKAEATGAAGSAHQHQDLSMLVDTKYWIRDMEFGERDNWRAGLKPCTLIERIAIEQEAAVISLGDSMDALGGAGIESNIRELMLAPNGVLLLEEDTISVGAMDPLFVQYLNQSGDCYDSTLFAGRENGPVTHPQFHFEPESDAMSWFNPENWHSLLNEDRFAQTSGLHYDSQKIPCSEDVVVFGSRQFSFWPTVQGNERAKTLAFKVNFRPSEADESFGLHSNMSSLSSLPSLRVSRLEINQHSYSQAEFDQLMDIYGDQLFQFHDNRSVLGEKFRPDGRQDILMIDDSSIHLEGTDSMPVCHEDAGCLCANERPNTMQIICSFLEAVQSQHLPCRDPIQVTGYCDKICATSLSIVMDPDKFKETFMASQIHSHVDEMSMGHFRNDIFIGQHRVDHNRYEVVFRPVPAEDDTYEQLLGREIELAQRIKEYLERSATKSFYGIRSISIRSSVEWRRNSQPTIMWATFGIAASLFVLVFVQNDEMFPIEPLMRVLNFLRKQLVGVLLKRYRNSVGLARGDSFLGQPMFFDQDGSVNEMPMDHLQEPDLASISLEAQSITDSTQNLIEPESYKH